MVKSVEIGTESEVRDLTPAEIVGKLAAPRASNPWLDFDDDAGNGYDIEGDLLKFSKGDWSAGADNTEIPIGTRMVVDMESMAVGWVRWGDGRPAEHRVGRIIDQFKAPERHELGFLDQDCWDKDVNDKPRDPWQRVVYLRMHAESDPAAVYTFSSTSKGGLNAAKGVRKHYGEEMPRHTAGARPIVELGVDSYNHSNRAFGKIKVPVLDIVGWTDGAGESGGRTTVTVIKPTATIKTRSRA